MFIEYRNTVKKDKINFISSDLKGKLKVKFILFFIINLIFNTNKDLVNNRFNNVLSIEK